jgi:hypothetical protein
VALVRNGVFAGDADGARRSSASNIRFPRGWQDSVKDAKKLDTSSKVTMVTINDFLRRKKEEKLCVIIFVGPEAPGGPATIVTIVTVVTRDCGR